MKPLLCALVLVAGLATLSPAAGPGDQINSLLRLSIPEQMSFCGEPVPLGQEDAWERLDLELIAILGSPVTTTLWLKRIPRYFPLIEERIRARGLPEDLKYVTLIESNLRASTVSEAGATGPWQFARATGALCGLERTPWTDERRDWDQATTAALEHLARLHETFGSWSLALAAYNAGESRVSRALGVQNQKSFYDLRLPRETERYVFRALAAKLVVENPQTYGIHLEGSRTYGPVDTVEVTVDVRRRSLPVAALAQAARVSYRWLAELNPWILGQALPRGPHRVAVPRASQPGFQAALARWETQNPEPDAIRYRVRPGDTLTSIAQRNHVSLEDLFSWNKLTRKSVIRPGQELVLLVPE